MFEFYFQSGEFVGEASGLWDFIKDLSVQIIGTTIGAGLAAFAGLWLYKKQLIDQKDKEEQAKNSLETSKLTYLTYLILKSEKFNRELIRQLTDAIKNLDEDPFHLKSISVSSVNTLERVVDKINQEEYYLSYVTRFPGKDSEISKIFDAIDAEKRIYELIEDTWSTHFRNNEEKSRLVSNADKLFSQELRHIEHNELLPIQMISDIVGIQKRFLGLVENSGKSHERTANQLYLPIADYFDKLGRNKLRPNTTKLYNIISEGYTNIMKLRNDNNALKNELETHLDAILTVQSIFDENLTTLRTEFPNVVIR